MAWRPGYVALGLAAVSVTAYLWLRCPALSSKVEIVSTFQRLRLECLAFYAEMAAVVALVGPGAPLKPEETLSQVLSQRLLISHGLFAASACVARRLGCRAEDLQTLMASYAEEAELREGLAEMREVHQSCVETGGLTAAFQAEALPGKNPWISGDVDKDSAQALQILKDLGERKARRLADLMSRSTGGRPLGPQILSLCEEVELEFWAEHLELHPQQEPLTLGPAVLALDGQSSFQESYTKLIKDLETELPKLGETPAVSVP